MRTALAALALILAAGPARAQSYLRFDVPDTALKAAVAASGPDFEAAWNSLLVAELRAISGSKNALVTEYAAHLLDLMRQVARAERDTLGTHIAADALALDFHWLPSERDQRIEAAVAESVATVAEAQRRYERAETYYRKARATYRQLEEKRREAWVVGRIGVVTYSRGDVAGADSVYREALDLRRQLGDPKLVGNTLNALGVTSQQLRRYREAYTYLQEARAVREQTGERAQLSSTLNMLGLASYYLGERDSARIWYQQALALAVAAGDSGRAAEALVNAARLSTASGRHAEALAAFDRALRIVRDRKDLRNEAAVHRYLGVLYHVQGRFAEAAQSLGQAIALDEQLQDPRTLAEDLVSLGRVAVGTRDPAGRPPLERALQLADSLGHPALQAEALNNLAILAQFDGDLRGAGRLAGRALAKASAARDSGLVHDAAVTLGQIARSGGDWGAARLWYQRALAAGSALPDEKRASDHHNLGDVLAQAGRLEEAEREFRATLDLAQRVRVPDLVWPALLGLGDVAEARGDFSGALAYDRRAASLIDTLRTRQGEQMQSIAVLSSRLFAFEALIHLLGKLEPRYPDSGYADEAFRWAERARARAFLDLIGGARAGARGASETRTLSLKEARGELDSDREALLEYSLGDSSSSLWLVTRRAARHLILPPRGTLRARAEIFRRGLGDPAGAQRTSTRAAARALYRALIEPVEADLAGITHLIVAPDDALALIPFEALLARDLEAGSESPGPGSYLVERFSLSYVPSATVLATLRTPARAGAVVALGDPRFGPDTSTTGARGAGPGRAALAALPNTAAEVEALRALAGSRRFVALTGAEATRERLLALPELSEAALLHLATHGVADEVEPARSGLWLAAPGGSSAGAPSAPGFLSVDDILGLRLNAELVTLSACETGLGRLERGEGVLGLTRAFLAAGARSVVVSLWRVNDRSTALLMEGFYRALLQRHLPREEALAEAKRALLAAAETRSPYYWAPFVLVGGGGKLK